MTANQSIKVGRDAVGNIMTVGNQNRIESDVKAELKKTTLPAAGSVDIGKELENIRAVLERIGGEKADKIGRAMDDAAKQARDKEPDKDKVGKALKRALDYSKTGSGFAENVAKLAPHVRNTVGWLGANWHKLLAVVGLAV
jgi:hypothetical protein